MRPIAPMSRPPSRTWPCVGGISPMIASARVDLPQPDSPTRPRHSPALTSSVTPSTAFSVFTPPERAPPTMKWTARSSRVSSDSAMVVAPDEAIGWQRGDVGWRGAANVGDRWAARVEAAAHRIGLDRRPDSGDLGQPLAAPPGAFAQSWQGIDQALRIGMAGRGEDGVGHLALDD